MADDYIIDYSNLIKDDGTFEEISANIKKIEKELLAMAKTTKKAFSTLKPNDLEGLQKLEKQVKDLNVLKKNQVAAEKALSKAKKKNIELTNEELIACNDLIKIVKKEILHKDNNVKAFNIGTSAVKLSGQTIMHCHIHLIPRREGDVQNPQGGVRSVIPKKQHYKRKI